MYLFPSILVNYKGAAVGGGKGCVIYARGFKLSNWLNHFRLDI